MTSFYIASISGFVYPSTWHVSRYHHPQASTRQIYENDTRCVSTFASFDYLGPVPTLALVDDIAVRHASNILRNHFHHHNIAKGQKIDSALSSTTHRSRSHDRVHMPKPIHLLRPMHRRSASSRSDFRLAPSGRRCGLLTHCFHILELVYGKRPETGCDC